MTEPIICNIRAIVEHLTSPGRDYPAGDLRTVSDAFDKARRELEQHIGHQFARTHFGGAA